MNGASYSDYNRDNFKCGEFKLLCEINNEDCEGKRYRLPEEEPEPEEVTVKAEEVDYDAAADNFDLRSADFAAFSFDAKEPEKYYCGSTIVSDR